jgi:hypothetical protein
VGASLGVPVVDLHSLFIGSEDVLVKKEYLYQMHPSIQGSCVLWGALARTLASLHPAHHHSYNHSAHAQQPPLLRHGNRFLRSEMPTFTSTCMAKLVRGRNLSSRIQSIVPFLQGAAAPPDPA